MIMNRKKPETPFYKLVTEYAQVKKPVRNIFVDRRTHIQLCQDSDGDTLKAKVQNGTTHLTFENIPVYPVLDDSFQLEFVK